MKRLGLSLALPPAMLFLLTSLRAADPVGSAAGDAKIPAASAVDVAPAPETSPAVRESRAKEILQRFDKNHDGKLDDDERADAHEVMMQEQGQRREAARKAAETGPLRERLLERFDKNHDGKLDEEERAAAKKFAEEKGLAAGGPAREELLKRFDKDGDGKLDPAERAEMQKFLQNRRGPGGPLVAMRQEMLRRFDKDGDGKISDAEWTDLEPALRTRIENAPQALQRYDKNADGKLDDAEWTAAQAQIRRWLDEAPPAEAAKPKPAAPVNREDKK